MAIKPFFTAVATSTGGRDGHSRANDGSVDVETSTPKELGGAGKPGATTPEHLFAVGYAACFGSAIDSVAKRNKKSASGATVVCAVTIGRREVGGLGLAVKMTVTDPSLPQAELEAFVKEAHEKVCPYSHATRGNVEVELDVHGA